ncbi:MAG TPA: cytochrome P450 [Polyangia bacterium]|nr:cytochrome P450 [Polyangia bacterium]
MQREPALLPSAIEEVLRHRSPAQTTFRVTRRPIEHGGRTIPAGKFVLVMIGAANRDPASTFASARRCPASRRASRSASCYRRCASSSAPATSRGSRARPFRCTARRRCRSASLRQRSPTPRRVENVVARRCQTW